jgi:general secretion pathway protein F
VVAIAVISILLVAVVPQVIDQFTHMKQELPMTTRTLIAVSDFLQAWGIVIAGGLFGASASFKFWIKRKEPICLSSVAVAKVTAEKTGLRHQQRALHPHAEYLQASSVPLLEGMYIAMDGIENLYARQVLEQAADTVRQGHPSTTRWNRRNFSTHHAVHGGLREESGELGSLMDRAAENQESALQHRITLTLSVFEPALVVTMATVVLFIVLSILQPLLQLNNMVG